MPSTTGFRDRALPVLRGSREPGESPEPWAASLAEELAREIEGEVRVGRHDRLLYATDASIYQVEPLGVVIPRSEADVETTVRFAARHELPLLPRGGGTSLAGQCVNRALIIDMAPFLNRIISIDPAGRTAMVQPGVVLDDLNTALASHGLMFGPDVATSSHANLGGMIGNNSAGAHSVLYGRTVEHLRGIEALLADGRRLRFDRESGRSDPQVQALIRAVASVVEPLAEEIDRRFPRIVRHVDGYNLDLMLAQMRRSSAGTLEEVNLAHLLCGSEGTLAVTVQAELNLVERPALKGLTVIGFPGVDQALGAVGAILATGPAAVELIDEMVLEQAARNAEYRRYLELLPRTGSALPGPFSTSSTLPPTKRSGPRAGKSSSSSSAPPPSASSAIRRPCSRRGSCGRPVSRSFTACRGLASPSPSSKIWRSIRWSCRSSWPSSGACSRPTAREQRTTRMLRSAVFTFGR